MAASAAAEATDPVSQLQHALIQQTHSFTVAVWELQQPLTIAEQDADRKAKGDTAGSKRKRSPPTDAGATAPAALGTARAARVAALASEIGDRARAIDNLIDALPGLGKTRASHAAELAALERENKDAGEALERAAQEAEAMVAAADDTQREAARHDIQLALHGLNGSSGGGGGGD